MNRIAFLASLVLLLLAPALAFPQTSHSKKRLVIILVPGLRAEDLPDPNLGADILVRGSAVGWMNARTARIPGQKRDAEAAAYLTLGSGARAAATRFAANAMAGPLSELRKANSRLDHPVQIGALGDLLRQSGFPTAILGAEDDVVPRRESRLSIMDSLGMVDIDHTGPDYWQVGVTNMLDQGESAHRPYGLLQTGGPYPRLVNEGLEVYVLGDLVRADRYGSSCTPEVAKEHRSKALALLAQQVLGIWFDEFFQVRGRQKKTPARYILLSPCAADSAPGDDRLAPIMMWGDGVKPGLLTSGSTHTPGLVTNTDFLPTVAQYFGITVPKGLVGRPMTVNPIAGPSLFERWWNRVLRVAYLSHSRSGPTPQMWAEMHDRWYAESRKQSVFGGFPTIQFLFIALVIYAGWSGRRDWRLGLPIVALPLLLLLLPTLSPSSVVGSGILLAAVMAAIWAIAVFVPRRTIGVVVGLLAVLLAVSTLDLLGGSNLMRHAWMSYSVMEGARYYGLGNEYAGAMFGAMMALSALLLRGEAVKKWPYLAFTWLIVVLAMGMPQFGADAGDFLGAGIGCGAAAIVWWRGKLRFRDLAAVFLAIAAVMGALAAYDLTRGAGDQSHIARAIGGGGLISIATRKAALNGYLLLHSVWSLGLLASIAGFVLEWTRPDSWLMTEVLGDRGVRGAVTGLIAGAAALLLLNDSGVVAASECLMLAYASLGLLLKSDAPAQSVESSPASA